MPSEETEEHRQFREYFVARRDPVRRTAHPLCGDWHWADDLTQRVHAPGGDSFPPLDPSPFQKYTRGDNGRTSRQGGVGLGSSLSRDPTPENLAHDDEVVYRSTDGLTWTRHPVNPPID